MRVWLPLAALYAAFLFWYGGYGTPLSATEVERLAERIEHTAPDPAIAARLLEFARSDDGREFFMVNLNRKWAALEVAHSFPATPAITLLGPRSAVLGGLFAIGVALRAAGRHRHNQPL